MSAFHQILQDLVDADSSIGAVFVDDSGETVDLATQEDHEEMRLLAAYAGIYLRQTERFCKAEKMGEVSSVTVVSEGLHLYALRLREGYSLISMSRGMRLNGLSTRRLAEAAKSIELEAFGKPVS